MIIFDHKWGRGGNPNNQLGLLLLRKSRSGAIHSLAVKQSEQTKVRILGNQVLQSAHGLLSLFCLCLDLSYNYLQIFVRLFLILNCCTVVFCTKEPALSDAPDWLADTLLLLDNKLYNCYLNIKVMQYGQHSDSLPLC